jgi:hypothetical protein
MAESTQREDPLLSAAKSGLLGKDIGRTICMNQSKRIEGNLSRADDDMGGPLVVGAWKGHRFS